MPIKIAWNQYGILNKKYTKKDLKNELNRLEKLQIEHIKSIPMGDNSRLKRQNKINILKKLLI